MSVSDNEVYAFSEMKKQPDKQHFEEAMFKITSSMFNNKVWEIVPMQEMNSYYD